MSEVLCPYCKEGLHSYGIIRCVRCGTGHHRDCWLEYGNHCAVFSCHGKNVLVRNKQSTTMLLPALWCLLNYALHLSLRLIGQLTGPIPLQDVFIVGILETVVIASGVMVLRGRSAMEPVRTIGILLFSGNALFLSLLFSHFVAHGFERLNALIRL